MSVHQECVRTCGELFPMQKLKNKMLSTLNCLVQGYALKKNH